MTPSTTSKVEHPPIKDFSYCLTSELDLFVRVKVYPVCTVFAMMIKDLLFKIRSSLHGALYDTIESEPASDLYITSQLWAQNGPLTPTLQTAYQHHDATASDDHQPLVAWHDILTFPIKYRDLTPDAHLLFNVWAPRSPHSADHTSAMLVGGTTLAFFGKRKYVTLTCHTTRHGSY